MAQKSVPMFAFFTLNNPKLNNPNPHPNIGSVWINILTLGFLWIQDSRDLVKIQENGSHFKMITHWDTYLTLILDYIY